MPVWNLAKKEIYFARVEELLGKYSKVFVVGVSGQTRRTMLM
jgi:hypothetical protein